MAKGRALAAVATAPGQIHLESLPLPDIGPGDLLMRVELCGICGSDQHLLRSDWGTAFPLILGHEFVGTVAEVGDLAAARHRVAKGDRIAVEMSVPCNECFWCRRGLYNLCERDLDAGWQFGCNIPTSRPPALWGGYAEYLYVPYRALVHRVSPDVPWRAAVLIEPLAVTVRAVNLTPITMGDTVVVVGPGTIGLLASVAAKSAGAGQVILVGTRDSRLELGRELGADVVVNAREVDAVARVRELTEGRGADVVLETAGTASAQAEAFGYARRGAAVTIVGLTGDKMVSLNTDRQLAFKEIRLQASYLSAWGYQGAIRIVESGRFPLAKLVTQVFPLSAAREALDFSHDRKDECIKAALAPGAG